jgi:hypothetical protein
MDVFDFSLSEHEMQRISDVEGPWWYRTSREGGGVRQLRSMAGTVFPDQIDEKLV